MAEEEPTRRSLARARDIFINNVQQRATDYTYENAMEDAGIPFSIRSQPANQEIVKRKVEVEMEGNTSHIDMSIEAKKQRFVTLFRLIYEGVKESTSGIKAKRIADVMKMAGYQQQDGETGEIYKEKGKQHANYAQCNRAAKKIMEELDEKYQNASLPTPAANLAVSIPETIEEDEVTEEVSHVTAPTFDSFACFSPGGSIEPYSPPPLPPAHILRTKTDEKSLGSTSTTSIISSLTSEPGRSRQTPAQAQEARQLDENLRKIYSCAYKVGTLLHSLHENNPCKHLNNATKVADQVNRLFGVEVITGRQLREAIKTDNVGKSPPRRGRPTMIPDNEFEALCDAFWSMCAVEQNNVAENRLDRADEIDLLDDIVNRKREKEGLDKVDAIKLTERINIRNSTRQKVTKVDYRKDLRALWCTKRNQLKHYNNFFDTMCKRGYARRPKDAKERAEEGYIVYHPGQAKLQINMDEMKFTFDVSKESAGGRPAMSHTTSEVPEGGKADKMNENGCTIVMAVNDCELLPIGVIIPTSAKDEKARVNVKQFKSFKQMKGQWGYDRDDVVADNYVAYSEKGSMNERILPNYCREVIQFHYPACQDVPGFRVCVKVDSGPGRQNPDLLFEQRAEGIDIYPGMPNASEVNQEMDQLFGPFKNTVYDNRSKLAQAKQKALNVVDVGYCLYGGTGKLESGAEIELENAVEMHFTPAKIRAAREHCGYCPATMNALNDPKLRGDILEHDDDEGSEEEEEQLKSMTDVLLAVERKNHEAVDELLKCGYTLASKLKRTVTRVKKWDYGNGITTLPHTRERQEAFEKVRYPGDFFQITDGGGVFNCSDMLIAMEMKDMKKQAKVQETKKKGLLAFYKVRKDATLLMRRKPYSRWVKSDFITAIKYKRGPFHTLKDGEPTTSSLQKHKVAELQNFYDKEYKGQRSAWSRQDIWTNKDEEKLQRHQDGEISCYTEGRLWGKAVETQNSFIRKKFEVLSTERKLVLLSDILKGLDDETYIQLMNMMPDDKKALSGPNMAPSISDDDEDEASLSPSTYHLSEEDQEFATTFPDDHTLVENEMTDEEMLRMPRDIDLQHVNPAGNEDEELAEEQPDADVAQHHSSVNDLHSDDSSLVSEGSFKVDDDDVMEDDQGQSENSMAHNGGNDEATVGEESMNFEEDPVDSSFPCPPSQEGSKCEDSMTNKEDSNVTEEAPVDSSVFDHGTIVSVNEEVNAGVAVTESIEAQVKETIRQLQEILNNEARCALYKLLIMSRGEAVGNRKKETALKNRWQQLEEKPLVWDINDFRSKLLELVHSC